MVRKILIVEDSKKLRDSVTEALSGEIQDCEVLGVSSFIEGIEIAIEQSISLVFLGIVNSSSEGLRFIQAIRKTNRYLPIISLNNRDNTNLHTIDILSTMAYAGNVKILSSPSSNREIIAAAQDMLNNVAYDI